jgi:hypothetical protein
MREQVDEPSRNCRRRANRKQQHQDAERTDRRIGEHALEIGLDHRTGRADEHGDCADDRYRAGPEHCPADDRRHSRDEINAGFHHRRGVEVCAHRRWRLHRIRQPEMKRELSRLGECGEQEECDDTAIAWIAGQRTLAGQLRQLR